MENCRHCGGPTITITMESGDKHKVHEHLYCKHNSHHGFYCMTTDVWIG